MRNRLTNVRLARTLVSLLSNFTTALFFTPRAWCLWFASCRDHHNRSTHQRLTVHDFTDVREAQDALRVIRCEMMARTAQLAHEIIDADPDPGEAVVGWNEHVMEMFALIDRAASIIDGGRAEP